MLTLENLLMVAVFGLAAPTATEAKSPTPVIAILATTASNSFANSNHLVRIMDFPPCSCALLSVTSSEVPENPN